jgi:hypothetical protein
VSNLSDLKQLGAFVPDELVKKEIKFSLEEGGEELSAIIHVRRLSIGLHEAIWNDTPGSSASKTSRLLAEAIRLGENGEERLTYDQAFSLHPRVALAMSTAITEVNGGERKN